MSDELAELRAAIRQELELARSGDGYEEQGVADEIVDRFVLPLFEPMRAMHYTPYVDEQHQGGYCFDFFASTLGRMARAERERDLLLWLHAEAVWWLNLSRDEHEADEILHVWFQRAEYATEQAKLLRIELERVGSSRQAWAEEALRLQMAVDKVLETYDGPATRLLRALADKDPADPLAGMSLTTPSPQCSAHDYTHDAHEMPLPDGRVVSCPGFALVAEPICACPTDEQASRLGPGFTVPVCAVHPTRGDT